MGGLSPDFQILECEAKFFGGFGGVLKASIGKGAVAGGGGEDGIFCGFKPFGEGWGGGVHTVLEGGVADVFAQEVPLVFCEVEGNGVGAFGLLHGFKVVKGDVRGLCGGGGGGGCGAQYHILQLLGT